MFYVLTAFAEGELCQEMLGSSGCPIPFATHDPLALAALHLEQVPPTLVFELWARLAYEEQNMWLVKDYIQQHVADIALLATSPGGMPPIVLAPLRAGFSNS